MYVHEAVEALLLLLETYEQKSTEKSNNPTERLSYMITFLVALPAN